MVGSETALHLLRVALSYNNWYMLYVYHNCLYYQCVCCVLKLTPISVLHTSRLLLCVYVFKVVKW